jgi:hypothetical protein
MAAKGPTHALALALIWAAVIAVLAGCGQSAAPSAQTPSPTASASASPEAREFPSHLKRATPDPDGGTVTGRVVENWGRRRPVAGDIVKINCGTGVDGETLWCLDRTEEDGSFSVSGVPQGWHYGHVGQHIEFTAHIAEPEAVVDLGTLECPLIHPPILSIFPDSGPPGTTVTLVGQRSHWSPGAELSVTVARPPESPDGEYVRATVSEDGTFSVSFEFPPKGSPYEKPGMVVFVVRVVGLPSGAGEVDMRDLPEVEATYIVTAPNLPTIGFSPAEVPAGAMTRVLIRNLPQNFVSGKTTVCVGLRRPDIGEWVNLGQVPPGSAEINMDATIPPDLPPGTYGALLADCSFTPNSGMGEGASLVVWRGVPRVFNADLPPRTADRLYRALAESIRQSGLVFHTVVETEVDSPNYSHVETTDIWIELQRNAARGEVRVESGPGEQELRQGTTIIVGDVSFRRLGAHEVERSGASECHGVGGTALSTVMGLPCVQGRLETDTEHEGQPAIAIVVPEGSTLVEPERSQFLRDVLHATENPRATLEEGEVSLVYSSTMYFDEETFLPIVYLAQAEVSDGSTQAYRTVMRFHNEFAPAESLPSDFFEPSPTGYVYHNPAEPLDQLDPSLTTYWLGDRFPGSPALPGLALDSVYIPQEWGWPDYEAILRYRLADKQFGPEVLTLQQWRLEDWQTASEQWRGAAWWDSPCVESREEALGEGYAVVLMGYENQPLPEPFGAGQPIEEMVCPSGPFDRFGAHAYLGSTVVVVDAPGVGGRHPAESPYDSLEGMQTVLRGLRARK